jgi:UDP-GlcNAc:undecaprenyl-phosphate/decaprenyl-phosphate GlcNAc-1-phosphate transferase
MSNTWYIVFAGLLLGTVVFSALLTEFVRRTAVRLNILDHPGERKVHQQPIPLMGGVAIVATFFLMTAVCFLSPRFMRGLGEDWLAQRFLAGLGDDATTKLGGLLAGSFLIFLLGVVDDLKALKPEMKLVGQIAAALVLVLSGMRIELFVLSNAWISAAITILWVVMLTNSLNFLDNMDGLSGGVAVISAFSFFLAVQPHEQLLVRLILVIFAGSVAGFLYHNLNPARIFMGDAGSMFCGYILATVAIMGTFHTTATPSRIAVTAPILALSVPLFDTASVIFIRWRQGESIMKGDKRHFSHRLVDLGMTPRQAVEFIYLVAAVVGLGGALLPQVGAMGTSIILGQTLGVFLLIVLLMNAGKRNGGS